MPLLWPGDLKRVYNPIDGAGNELVDRSAINRAVARGIKVVLNLGNLMTE